MAKLSQRKQADFSDPHLDLIRRIARRDDSALEELYRQAAPGLLVYLIRRLDNAGLAEEVLQDVFLAVWTGAGNFRGVCRVSTWLLTIARNRAANAYHRQLAPHRADFDLDELAKRLPDAVQAAPDAAEIPSADLAQALRSLPDAFREPLELVFYHGLSLEETALVLDVPPGTIKSRLHRAKARLRSMLGENHE